MNSHTRRHFIGSVLVLPALAALLEVTSSPAQAKGSQAQFKYQNKPNNGQKCSGCRFFTAGKTPTANGTCQIVDGAISPNGWCTAYAAKPT